jgi:hypothetical protein
LIRIILIQARDDVIRAGGKPKNHMSANKKALKEQQIQNKIKKEAFWMFF